MTIIKLGSTIEEIDIDFPVEQSHSDRRLLLRILAELKHQEHQNKERHHKIMSVLSDLQDATALLTTNVASSRSAVLSAIADINTLPTGDAALVPLTVAITAAATDLADQSKQLLAAVNATPVTPTPPPPVTPPAPPTP